MFARISTLFYAINIIVVPIWSGPDSVFSRNDLYSYRPIYAEIIQPLFTQPLTVHTQDALFV